MHIIFLKLCILIVQVIFIHSRVQRKRKYHYLCMHTLNILNFPDAIQISNVFNQCANFCGHIHTQCTLTLISSFPCFMKSNFPWCIGDYPSTSPYGLFILVHCCSKTMLPATGWSRSQISTYETKSFSWMHPNILPSLVTRVPILMAAQNYFFFNTSTIQVEYWKVILPWWEIHCLPSYANMHFLNAFHAMC